MAAVETEGPLEFPYSSEVFPAHRDLNLSPLLPVPQPGNIIPWPATTHLPADGKEPWLAGVSQLEPGVFWLEHFCQ